MDAPGSRKVRKGTIHDVYNVLPMSTVPAQQKLARRAATFVSYQTLEPIEIQIQSLLLRKHLDRKVKLM